MICKSSRDKVLGTNTNTGSSISRLFEYIQVQEVSQLSYEYPIELNVPCIVLILRIYKH